MEKTRQMYMRVIFLYGIIFTAWIFWAVCGRQAVHAVSRFFHRSGPRDEVYDTTAVQYRYPEAFQKTLGRYRSFADAYSEADSPAIPGLAFTELDGPGCSQMVPQGICIAGEYLLISAYDNGANAGLRRDESYVPQKSVIYILSFADKEFLTTLILPDVNHVGGLAFDGSRIWIAKSSTGTLSAVSYGQIEAAARCGKASMSLSEYEATVPCGMTASFVSFYKNRLWVGTYSSVFKGRGTMTSFLVEEEGGLALLPERSFAIPSCTQGIAFLEQEGRTYMALSTSWGRYVDSMLYMYELSDGEPKCLDYMGSMSLPPMSEELVSDGIHTYVLFESGATCYSGSAYRRCPYPVDRVCGLENRRLLAGMGL